MITKVEEFRDKHTVSVNSKGDILITGFTNAKNEKCFCIMADGHRYHEYGISTGSLLLCQRGAAINDGDLIIVKEDGTPYFIDWSHATQGNASADVARTYMLFWLAGDIEGAEKYLDLFCQKSGTDKRYVQKWMPIVAASQSVKGHEKEREFLMSWIDVAEFQ